MNNRLPGILFISQDASLTGAPIFLLRFLQWFREHTNVPFHVLIGRWGKLFPDFECLGPVDLFEPRPTLARRILRRLTGIKPNNSNHLSLLRQKLSESNIGVIYSNTIVNGHILDFLSFLRCPVICHVHELEYAISNIGAENFDLVRKYTSSYIAVSRAVKRNLVENRGILDRDVDVIHGFIPIGVTPGDVAKSPTDVRKELGIAAESKLVCACGSIEPRKGTDLFLQVARRVVGTYNIAPVHFLWVGGDLKQVRAMRKEAKSLSLQSVVHFVGHKSDVESYYNASDLFLLPSREDPFPLVMLEAAWRGKAIVCFDNAGGAPEFVGHDAGFVVPAFDVEEMSDRVVTLLSSNDLRGRMGTIAQQRVANQHDLSEGAAKIARLIDDKLFTTFENQQKVRS